MNVFLTGNRCILNKFVPAIEIAGSIIRFPSIDIEPDIADYGLLSFPLFDKRFSRPGESGSWGSSRCTGRGIGMVVGGHDNSRTTQLHQAGPLLKYFQHLLDHQYLLDYQHLLDYQARPYTSRRAPSRLDVITSEESQPWPFR